MSETKNDSLQNENNKSAMYWRSIEELHGDEEALKNAENEFAPGVKEEYLESDMSGISRRKFLALIGATTAFAAAGCSDYRDKGEIIPYNKKPEEVYVGKPNFYASTCTSCANACGILIKTREGRPLKVEGNPEHPINKGKICTIGEASVLNLYDPARIKTAQLNKEGKSFDVPWADADTEIISALKKSGKEEVAIVSSKVVSPTHAALIEEFVKKYPSVKFYYYDLLSNTAKANAFSAVYGTDTMPSILWEKAKIILSLEGDFLGSEGKVVEQIKKFTSNRDINNLDGFNRLYSVEGTLSVTGMNADYRLRLKPEAQTEFILALVNEIALVKNSSAISLDGTVKNLVSAYKLEEVVKKHNLNKKSVESLVSDLIAEKGKSLVYAGRALNQDAQVAALLLNEVVGGAALYSKEQAGKAYSAHSSEQELEDLVAKMNDGKIKAVIHYDTNPVYTLPGSLKYADALKKVSLVVTLTELENETSSASKYVLPLNHTFESWGDAKSTTGVISTQQPVIAPLYDTRQKEGALLFWLNEAKDTYNENLYHAYLKANWKNKIYPTLRTSSDFDRFWSGVLHDGVVLDGEVAKVDLRFDSKPLAGIKVKESDKFTLLLTSGGKLADGKYANNGWLQEMPHPVTKVTWDNYAAISYETSKKLNVKTGDMLDISLKENKISIPVYVVPGIADDVVAIDLGYGRKIAPAVAVGVGTDVMPFISLKSETGKFVCTGAEVVKGVGQFKLGSTVEYHVFDDAMIKDQHKKREIIQEATVEEYKKNPLILFGETKEEVEAKKKEKEEGQPSLYANHEYKDVKWGMAIDLNKCIGCSQCVVSCDVENNIPVVGRDQVTRGRIMHWLRLDRYFSGSADEPVVSTQPMMCQHCDNAPCENVCPVVATTHSPEGLNQMVYNRCVGTRYCSNNCPYKVRRFNFYNFRDHFKDGFYLQPANELAMNPEVTVRSRGVMEKCTFCIQRIQEAKANAVAEGRTVKGSDVKTACQAACPADAIVFGDLNDKESQLVKLREHNLGYHVLEELNVKPNITYVAKLRNRHSEEV